MNSHVNSNKIKIIDLKISFLKILLKLIIKLHQFFKKMLNYAHNLCEKKDLKGFINCPIDKKLLNKKGVTEYLAAKCNVKNNSEVMLIKNKKDFLLVLLQHI